MKKFVFSGAALLVVIILAVVIYQNYFYTQTEKPYCGAPKITLNGNIYFQHNISIVTELPDGYTYAGTLSEEEAEYAYANMTGCKYYIDKSQDELVDFYVYQECGTPISEDTVDNTKRQWAYVKWTVEEDEN